MAKRFIVRSSKYVRFLFQPKLVNILDSRIFSNETINYHDFIMV